jgi:hypothetical protein
VSKTLFIESFELDYDGDGEKDVEGSNPESNQSLLHTYDKKGRFLPQGKYIGIDRITRKPTIKAINLPVMNIVGIVQVSEKQVGDKKSVVFDASSLRQIGKIFWYTIDDMEKEKSRDSLFTVVR